METAMRGLAAAVLALMVLGLVVFIAGQRSGAEPPIREAAVAASNTGGSGPVLASIKEVMQSIVDPSADVLWGAVGTVVDNENGIQDLRPKTPEEWLNVR